MQECRCFVDSNLLLLVEGDGTDTIPLFILRFFVVSKPVVITPVDRLIGGGFWEKVPKVRVRRKGKLLYLGLVLGSVQDQHVQSFFVG